jgi:hypothetical protein
MSQLTSAELEKSSQIAKNFLLNYAKGNPDPIVTFVISQAGISIFI